MMNNFSDENFEVVTGHDGRKVRIVKDGSKVVVGMRFMDLMDAIQRQVASDYVAEQPRVRAFDGTNAGLHRPGARFADERHVDPLVFQGNARDRALLYRMYDAEKASEFRGHPGGAYYQGGADEWRGSQPGDDCTVNGYPGTLVEEGGRLVCKIKRTEAAAYDDATCSRCGGSGIEPGHRQSGWIYQEDEEGDEDEPDDDTVLELMGWNATTHHEGSQRNDVRSCEPRSTSP